MYVYGHMFWNPYFTQNATEIQAVPGPKEQATWIEENLIWEISHPLK